MPFTLFTQVPFAHIGRYIVVRQLVNQQQHIHGDVWGNTYSLKAMMIKNLPPGYW